MCIHILFYCRCSYYSMKFKLADCNFSHWYADLNFHAVWFWRLYKRSLHNSSRNKGKDISNRNHCFLEVLFYILETLELNLLFNFKYWEACRFFFFLNWWDFISLYWYIRLIFYIIYLTQSFRNGNLVTLLYYNK